MNSKRVFTWALAVAAVITPAVTRAGDDPVSREQDSVARVSAANVVAERHGRYLQARQMTLEGAGAVKGRTEAWLGATNEWIAEWAKALALADLRNDVPYATFESELTTLLEQQTKALGALQEQATAIGQLASQATSLVSNPEAVPAIADLAPYAPALQLLVQREDELRAAASEIGHTADARSSRLQELDELTRRGLLARLKAALLAQGRYPLEQTLTQVDALLLAEKTIDPLLARLDGVFTRMNGYNANLAYFHGVTAIEPARKDCADARRNLDGMTMPAAFVARAKTRTKTVCDGIEGLYASLTGDTSVSKAEYVGEYLRTEKTRLAAACPKTVSSPPCEKLALFAALSQADLDRMDDARLRFVELGWSEALDRAQGR